MTEGRPTVHQSGGRASRFACLRRLGLLGVLVLTVLALAGAGAARPTAADLTGTWHCCGGGGAAAQDFVITSGKGALAGQAVLPGGQVFAAITGSVSGTHVTIVTTYNAFAPGYVAPFVGTLSGDGNTITGTWTSNRGQAGTFTATRAAQKKATLAVDVEASVPDAAVGTVVAVKVRVTAGAKKVTAVTLGKGLVIGGPVATLTSSPSGSSGFTLAAGASRTFAFKVKAVKAGTAKLGASASGRSGTSTISGSGSDTLKVGKSALAITMTSVAEGTKLARFPLEVTDEGVVKPRNISVKVKLTNTSKVKIEGVSFESLRPVPVDRTLPLDQLGFDRGTFPVKLGTFLPGSTATRTFTLAVTGDGKYELHALVLTKDPAAANGTGVVTAIGGEFESTVPALFYTAKRDDDNIADRNGTAFVKAGTPWYVSAKLKNVSTYRPLCVLPMAPTIVGNASSAGPINIALRDLRSIGGPHAGELAPGKDVPLLMVVDSSPNGSTVGKVDVEPTAVEIDRGAQCTEATARAGKKLGATDRRIVAGSTSFSVKVDVSAPLKEPVNGFVKTVNAFGGIAHSLFFDTLEQVGGLVALAHSAASTPAQYGLMGQLYPTAALGYAATLKACSLVYTATQVYADYWRTATAAEKDSLFAQAGSVLSRITGDFFTEGAKTVREGAEPFMNDLEKAYATGDDARVWHLWGRVGGHVLQQVVTLVFAEVLGAKIAANEGKLEAAAQAATEEWVSSEATVNAVKGTLPADAALETVPPGSRLNLSEMESLWGQDAASDVAFARIAKEEEVVLGVRGRQIESVKKLETGSVWKHENLKPKNVSEIDIEWLGFRRADKAEVRFRTYTPAQEATIRQRVGASGLTGPQREVVLKRLETRLGEAQYVDKIKSFAKKGEINVGFNYRDNGLNRATTQQVRRFSLVDEAIEAEGGIPGGGTYYTPLQENLKLYDLRKGGVLPPGCRRLLASVLCTVTGDMDGVYITTVNGGSLSAEKMARVYERLQKAGWQHPETLTWINDQGQFLFGAKSKILKGLEQGGGEAMIEYAPDGVRRATYLNLDQSVLLAPNKFRLQVVGGYTGEASPLAALAR